MLVKNFYTIINTDLQDDKAIIKISLNKDHELYEGQFPDQPIVPGVMQVQIIKELLSDLAKKQLQLKSAANIKYLALMIPEEYDEYEVEISFQLLEDNLYKTKAVIKAKDKIFLKFSGNFKPV